MRKRNDSIERVNRRRYVFFLFLALALCSFLVGGGILHTFIEHSHDTEAALSVHAALRFEKIFSFAAFLLFLTFSMWRERTLVAVHARGRHSLIEELRRGIVAYRKFR